ncbi:MAG: HAMP domain-containing protein [Rhodospirillales bacterium]|nr:HAMP domain-containing protein [Rhodospirillales bacterium]
MEPKRNLEHDFLELSAADKADHTFLGTMRLSGRANLFLISGLVAIVLFAGIMLFADHRLQSALDAAAAAERMAAQVQLVEKGIAHARGEEKTFVLKKDPAIAVSFRINIEAVIEALDKLSRMPESVTLRRAMATIRDGLAQYDQQFSKLVAAEKELGLVDGSGLSRQLQLATEELQAKFSTAGFANLAGQVARINQEGQETLLSGYKRGVGEIQKRYQTLVIFLNETKIPANKKKALQDLLKKHETYMLAMINSRFAFEEDARRFDDIVTYLSPSINAMSGYADKAYGLATEALGEERKFIRWTVGAGSAAVLVMLILIGQMLLRSVIGPVRVLAHVAGRLADGDKAVTVPGRGNSDSTGAIARALDRWVESLSDLDGLRQELSHTKTKLEQTLAEAEKDALAAAQAARQALLSDDREDDIVADPGRRGLPPMPSMPRGRASLEGEAVISGGPLSSVSRQLTSFSEYVTAAANDVERTEALMKGLQDAHGQIEEMGSLVTAIRDQTNLLAFRTSPKEEGPDNLVILSGEDQEPIESSKFPDADMAKRFDAIREATDRAERTTHAVRNTVADVTRMAQDIAATASAQALEATSKLLSQSEYLQNMLDDVISKIRPDIPGNAPKQKAEDEKPARKEKTPPKKA